jgi:hypothetical protein
MFKTCVNNCFEAIVKQSIIENEETIVEKPENCGIEDEDVDFNMIGINDDFEKTIEDEFSELFDIEEEMIEDIKDIVDDASGMGLSFMKSILVSGNEKIDKKDNSKEDNSKKRKKNEESTNSESESESADNSNNNDSELILLESLEDLKDTEDTEDTVFTKYAPKQLALRGEPTLCVIGLRWTSKNPAKNRRYRKRCENLSGVRKMGRIIENFYEKNSRGKLKFKVSAFVENVPFNANNGNLKKAEKFAMNRHTRFDYYAIMSSLNVLAGKKPSNAGRMDGKMVAHLRGNNMRTGCHEMGHLLGLKHAGAYVRGKLDPYGDGFSVMSGIPSGLLNASQYYNLGWLPEKEVAIFEPGTIYELKRVSEMNKDTGLTAVLVKNDKGRDAWISRPAKCLGKKGKGKGKCLVLHLATDGGAGTQRVNVFGKSFYDKRFTKLKIENLGQTDDGNLKVSIEYV